MKTMRILFVLILLGNIYASGQTSKPFAIWEDQVNNDYYFVRLDGSTGIKTDIHVIPGMLASVAGGKTAFDNDRNYYHFTGYDGSDEIFYTVEAVSGNIIYNPILADNVVGLEYNCNDSMIYGLRVNASNYELVTVDPSTGLSTALGSPIAINAYVGESFSLDLKKSLYSFIALIGGNFFLRSYSIPGGALVYDNPFPDNVTAIHFSCHDSTLYGLWEDSSQYKLEKIDLVTGTHSTVSVLAGVTPGYVLESSDINNSGLFVYRGFDSTNAFSLITIDLATGSVSNIVNTTDNSSGFREPLCCLGSSTVSVEEIGSPEITIYPLPTAGYLEVNSDEYITGYDVFTLDCRNVLKKDLKDSSNKNIRLNLTHLSRGVYMLRLYSRDGNIVNKRIIIE